MGLMIKKPEHVAGSAAPAILIGLFVAFGGVLFGYDTGTIGGTLLSPLTWSQRSDSQYRYPGDAVLEARIFNRIQKP